MTSASKGVEPIDLLLTRPRAASERFAAELRAGLGRPVRITISPVLQIVPQGRLPDLGGVAGLVFTSENGVAAFSAASGRRDLPAWCVGPRTAAAARGAGLDARMAGGSVASLGAAIAADPPQGPLLHIRGRAVSGDLAGDLQARGIPCEAAILYDQVPVALGMSATALLSAAMPVLVPVFSPRSALLLAPALQAAHAPLLLAAISPAVAEALPVQSVRRVVVSERPDAPAMVQALRDLARVGIA